MSILLEISLNNIIGPNQAGMAIKIASCLEKFENWGLKSCNDINHLTEELRQI